VGLLVDRSTTTLTLVRGRVPQWLDDALRPFLGTLVAMRRKPMISV